MKILHIGPVKNKPSGENTGEILDGFGADGPSRSIVGLATSLAAIGVQTAILSTKPFDLPNDRTYNGVYFLNPYTGKKYDFFVNAEKWARQIVTEFGIPDWINFHDVYDLFSVVLARHFKKLGWKYIVTPRGGLRKVAQSRDGWKKKIANPFFFNSYLRGSEFITALALGEAKDIAEFDPSLKIHIIPNGILKSYFDEAGKLATPKPYHKDITIGFLGQLYVHIKGVDLLLQAICRIQTQYPDINLNFIFAGPVHNKNDQVAIHTLVKQLPCPDRVVFIGPVFGKAKIDFFNSIDVFVLPSRTEGMPVVGLEAMSFGKPCLFSEGSNMHTIITKAQGGWSSPCDADVLSRVLFEIVSLSPEQLLHMGQNSRAYIAKHFLWEIVVQKYIEVLNK